MTIQPISYVQPSTALRGREPGGPGPCSGSHGGAQSSGASLLQGTKRLTTKQTHDDAFWKPTRSLQSADNLAGFSSAIEEGVDEAQGEDQTLTRVS